MLLDLAAFQFVDLLAMITDVAIGYDQSCIIYRWQTDRGGYQWEQEDTF